MNDTDSNPLSSIDPTKIIETAELLKRRISERLPSSNLNNVASELVRLAGLVQTECAILSKPMRLLRVILTLLCLGFLSTLFGVASHIKLSSGTPDLGNFLQALEAGVNLMLVFGAALIFVISLERRFKQRKALKALHRLRSLAHVIDLHQLTKDPERWSISQPTQSSPQVGLSLFQVGRYLDYCSEMLSLIGKLSALYIQNLQDPIIVEAGSDIEALTTALSHKIWQKISILHLIEEKPEGRSSALPRL